MKYANLHLHSIYSDAWFTPYQLVVIGKSLGYQALALTDHQTDGGWHTFKRCAEQNGITPVLGAELCGNFEGKSLHFTALDYDYDHPGMRALIRRECEAMTEWTRRRFQRAVENGWISGLEWEQIVSMFGPDTWICHDSVQYAANVLRVVPDDFNWGSFREKTWKAPEVKAWKQKYPAAEEVIPLVREAGGVIAWAHPDVVFPTVEKLVKLGLNGIEVNHPDMTEQATADAEEAARKFNLYRSGGTDHTGPMSGVGGKFAIPVFNGIDEEDFRILMERRLG
jgi:predicted metal-dependent phosphoesterase TrpH